MRSIRFIAPVESMQGKLSGNQDLKYAENNNPAYEAPNGTQYARNYVTRYIGNRRSKDGANYFSVKQRTATTLDATSRRNMALIAVQSAWFSAIRSSTNYSTLVVIYEFAKGQAGSSAPAYYSSLRRWITYQLRDALLYRKASITISGPAGSVTLQNPFPLTNTSATTINTDIWVKFANFFASNSQTTPYGVGGSQFYVDGKMFFAYNLNGTAQLMLFDDFANVQTGSVNPNFDRSVNQAFTSDDDDNLLYNSLQVYTSAGVAVKTTDAVIANERYTTAAPLE